MELSDHLSLASIDQFERALTPHGSHQDLRVHFNERYDDLVYEVLFLFVKLDLHDSVLVANGAEM